MRLAHQSKGCMHMFLEKTRAKACFALPWMAKKTEFFRAKENDEALEKN